MLLIPSLNNVSPSVVKTIVCGKIRTRNLINKYHISAYLDPLERFNLPKEVSLNLFFLNSSAVIIINGNKNKKILKEIMIRRSKNLAPKFIFSCMNSKKD